MDWEPIPLPLMSKTVFPNNSLTGHFFKDLLLLYNTGLHNSLHCIITTLILSMDNCNCYTCCSVFVSLCSSCYILFISQLNVFTYIYPMEILKCLYIPHLIYISLLFALLVKSKPHFIVSVLVYWAMTMKINPI